MSINIYNKKVLVTGASSGVGKTIAELLLNEGYDVYGTTRYPEKQNNKLDGISYLALDLQDPKSIDACAKMLGTVDILINNAGQSQVGPLEEVPMEKIYSLFEVNLFGIIRLTKALLPGMRKQKKGLIINVSSMSGIFGVGFTPVYCGTKFALEGVFKSLRQEVYPFGIDVVMLQPGYIATGLKQEPFLGEGGVYFNAAKKFRAIRDHNIESGVKPEVVAAKVLKIIKTKHPKPAYPVGGDAPRNAFLNRILPVKWVESFQRKKFSK